MADLTFGIRLKADGSGFVGEVKLSKAALDGLGKEAAEAARRAGHLSRETGTLGQRMERMRRGALSLKSALAGIGVVLLAKRVVDAGIAMQRIDNALRAATGSSEAAKREFGFVRREAERLGLDLQTSADQYAKLAAAAKGTSLEGQDARDIFTAVSEAATVLGLSAEEASGALTAMQQVISKGKVSAEELRGQLGERIPGAFQIAARAIGVTTAELDKMLSTGQLAAEDLLPAMAREMRETFGPSLASAVRSTQSEINRFGTALFELESEFAKSGFLAGFTEALTGLTAELRNPAVRAGLQELGANLGGLIVLIAHNARRIVIGAGALLGLFIGARAGPIGAAAGFLAGLIGTIKALEALDVEDVRRLANTAAVGPVGTSAIPGGAPKGSSTVPVEQIFPRFDEFTFDQAAKLNDRLSEQTTLMERLRGSAQDLGLTFTSSFEDAIDRGAKFSEVLKGIAKDIQRILMRRLVTEPLAGAISSGLDSLFAASASTPVPATAAQLKLAPAPFHRGGTAGAALGTRRLPATLFAGAPRFHGGLMAGEVPAVLRAGERVRTPEQEAALANGKVSVTVNNFSGEKASVSERRGPMGQRDIVVTIGEAMARDVRGGGALHGAIAETFALSPRALPG